MTCHDKIELGLRDYASAARSPQSRFLGEVARQARAAVPRSAPRTASAMSQSLLASPAARKRRQDDLLDEALLETFPASDPVSVVHVE